MSDILNGSSERADTAHWVPEPVEGPRHTLWVVPVADLGGVARHVIDVTRVGIPGWRVTVLCPEGPLADRLRAQGSAVVAAPFGPDAGPLKSMRTLRRTAATIRPDIVHSHLAYADIINAWTPLPSGTRRFTTEHGIAGDDGVYHRSSIQSRLMALVHRLRFPRFAGVIAVAEATKRVMIQKWKVRQHIEVIPNGVDLPDGVEPRNPSTVTGMRVLSLSRLAPEKRIDSLLDAFALLRSEHSDATLTIAGLGPTADALRAQVARLGLADVVSFLGHINAHDAMDEADVVAQLSVWENCSYTLLDAVARGLRVVASDVGGNREIVGPRVLPPRFTTRDVVDAVKNGTAAHDQMRPNDIATAVARLSKAYERAVR
ncbi:glycosyltransferase family 4 protein [Microbacterium sp. SD291]|uniref:glycosyltransferase family 4 protein n=1 Tax=Microbacterium sp. SD291 TaxID=2782007 RepID=UPI001A969298|nr:glycosyltransferase family 4 protein [Microbacterium sp. SD291]MBO0981017.1 glycosyltransferase family 4 protein [Microbacterium sp. SD291]